MRISIIAKNTTDITPLLTSCTWSGDRTQAARKLNFTFIQDDRDSLLPIVEYDCGYTVHGFDDEGKNISDEFFAKVVAEYHDQYPYKNRERAAKHNGEFLHIGEIKRENSVVEIDELNVVSKKN